jgi:NitT/TauT family transport system substrate-binding protein
VASIAVERPLDRTILAFLSTGRKKSAAVAVALIMSAVALWAGLAGARATPPAAKVDTITLQLNWVTRSQFAGYYTAKALGFYKAFGLDVNIRLGGPDITPEHVVASGKADIGVDWLPNLLATRDTGTSLVNIAQMFARSAMTELTWKTSGIDSIAAMRNKTVGVWCCGNQVELYAALAKNGMDPQKNKGVKIFNQPFDMNAFLQKKIDAAAAITYNQLGQVLESKNPTTGGLYRLTDLNVFKLQDEGTGMLEDGLFARQDWLNDNRDVAMRFIAASDRGWIYCRDHVQHCTRIVLENGPTLAKGHQLWQMNEINKLIWPNTEGIGVMDPAAFEQTAALALKYKAIKRAANAKAYDPELAKDALQYLKDTVAGIDVTGKAYKPLTVKVTPGGR